MIKLYSTAALFCLAMCSQTPVFGQESSSKMELPPYDITSPHSEGKFGIPPRHQLQESKPWLDNIAEKIRSESISELSKLPETTSFKCVLYFHSGTFFKHRLTQANTNEVNPAPWKSYIPQLVTGSGNSDVDEKLLAIVQKASPLGSFAPFLCGYRFPIYITIKGTSVKATFGEKSELMDSYFLKTKSKI